MNVLSLFDGISCGQVALERAGVTVDKYFASEIDKNAMLITQRNYPRTIQVGDVSNIKGRDLPKIDLLIGGSPCQGFSYLGNQLNFIDPRSRLFFEYVRVLNEVKPKYFLLENVKMKQEYQDIITRHMGVEPILVDSEVISAQMRKRLYWTNIPGVEYPQRKNITFQDVLESGYTDREKALCILESENRLNISSQDLYRRNKTKALGNIVYFSKELDPAKGVRMLTQIELEKLQTLPVGYTQPLKRNAAAGLIGNGWTVDVIAHIFDSVEAQVANAVAS